MTHARLLCPNDAKAAPDPGRHPRDRWPGSSSQGTPAASLSHWAAPLDIDHSVPAVRTDIVCPLPLLLQGVSERVQELVANVH